MVFVLMIYVKIPLQDIVLKVLIKMAYIKLLLINMILMVMIYMDLIKMVAISTSKAKSFKDGKALSKIFNKQLLSN